jgi:protein-tyrosine phosphatase
VIARHLLANPTAASTTRAHPCHCLPTINAEAAMHPTLYTVQRHGPGRLSTMAKPRGGDWLEDELRGLCRLGVDVLVCALPAAELEEVDLADEPRAAELAGLEFVWIPIADRAVPDLADLLPVLEGLIQRLRRNQHLTIHCRFGIGRASLLAAALLRLEGMDADQAWGHVARARGRPVPDTDEQRLWIARLRPPVADA